MTTKSVVSFGAKSPENSADFAGLELRFGVVQRADIRVVEGRDRARLALEAPAETFLRHLDRNLLVEPRIHGQVRSGVAPNGEVEWSQQCNHQSGSGLLSPRGPARRKHGAWPAGNRRSIAFVGYLEQAVVCSAQRRWKEGSLPRLGDDRYLR